MHAQERWKWFPQLPSHWHRNSALSPTRNHAPLLCLRPPSTPCLYPVYVQAVLGQLPGGTSLQSFISGGVQNPTLQKPLQLGFLPTLWRRVSLSNGWVPACPRKHSCSHVATDDHRLWQITTHSLCQVLKHPCVFVLIPRDMAALQGPLGPLPARRPYGLYQMHFKQGNCFSPCGTRIPQTLLPSRGDSPYFLPTTLPGTEL